MVLFERGSTCPHVGWDPLRADPKYSGSQRTLAPSEALRAWTSTVTPSKVSKSCAKLAGRGRRVIKYTDLQCKNVQDRSGLAFGWSEALDLLLGNRGDSAKMSKQPDMQTMKQLFTAVSQGDKKKLESLLSSKYSPDVKNDTHSLMHAAAEYGQTQILDVLINKGANVNILDSNGATPLHYGVKHNRPNALRFLLERGASLAVKDSNGAAPLHWACQLGKLDCARVLVDKGADIEAKAKYETTALHLAARAGLKDIVTYLCQNKANTEARTNKGYTPLHIAAMKGLSDMCNILLHFRGHVDALTLRRQTALHFTAMQGDIPTSQILLRYGAWASAMDADHNTPASNAQQNGHAYLAAYLERCAFPVFDLIDDKLAERLLCSVTNFEDLRAITLTCKRFQGLAQKAWRRLCSSLGCTANPETLRTSWCTHFSLVRLLRKYYQQTTTQQLENALLREIQRIGHPNTKPNVSPAIAATTLVDHGVDPNAFHRKTRIGAVHLALQKRSYDLVHMLVERGADINAQKSSGNAPLHDAAEQGEERLAAWLIDLGADSNLKSARGETPATHAALCGQWKLVYLLVKKGADVNAVNSNNETALHIASSSGAGIQVVHKLLDLGGDVNQHGFAGNTALHLAAFEGFADMMQALIERGAAVNAVNSGGSSALHLAVFFNHLPCVQLLIQNQANPNLQNNDGHTPYYFARLLDKTRILDWLESICTVHVSKEHSFYLVGKA